MLKLTGYSFSRRFGKGTATSRAATDLSLGIILSEH